MDELRMDKFEALSQNELIDVDGGLAVTTVTYIAIGIGIAIAGYTYRQYSSKK